MLTSAFYIFIGRTNGGNRRVIGVVLTIEV